MGHPEDGRSHSSPIAQYLPTEGVHGIDPSDEAEVMTASLSLPLLPPSILAPVLRVHLVARRAVASSIYHSIHPSLISSPPPLPLLTPVLRVHSDTRRADYLPDSIKVMVWRCILQIMASIAAQRRLASVNCHLSYVTCNLSRVRMCARTASQKGFSPLPSACLPPRLLAAASPPTRLAASSRPWSRIRIWIVFEHATMHDQLHVASTSS